MKLKTGFFLRVVGDEAVVVPVGQRVADFSGLVALNETGSFIWKLLSDDIAEEDLAQAVADEYDVELEQARKDVSDYLSVLLRFGVVE